jgi:hypothetical protein
MKVKKVKAYFEIIVEFRMIVFCVTVIALVALREEIYSSMAFNMSISSWFVSLFPAGIVS